METCPCIQRANWHHRKDTEEEEWAHINFVKEGNPTTVKTPLEQETNLESATSWEMQAYLGWRLVFFRRNLHQSASWHCIMAPRRQKDNHGGTYGPMGREMLRGLPDEWNKVSRSGRRHPLQRMKCMGFPNW